MRNQIFISYSHQDKALFEEFKRMLCPALRNRILDLWDDTRIAPGKIWREEIGTALASARIAVLLVSPDFLASDFIAQHELPPLLNAAKGGGLTVFWIYLSECLYDLTEIKDYQAAHDVSMPLDRIAPAERGAVWKNICKKLLAIVSDPNP